MVNEMGAAAADDSSSKRAQEPHSAGLKPKKQLQRFYDAVLDK